MSWINEFKKLLETSVQPEALAQLKNEYIKWVQQRGAYYISLKKTCPEFLDLLTAIEEVIKVEVRIEPPKANKQSDKE